MYTLVIDYAHNPHGMAALAGMVAALPARRRLVLLGQAGDRSDESIRELARSALALQPDRIVLKEMDRYLRGRRPGEVPGLMADELTRRGVPATAMRPAGRPSWRRCAMRWPGPARATCCCSRSTRTGRWCWRRSSGSRRKAGRLGKGWREDGQTVRRSDGQVVGRGDGEGGRSDGRTVRR